MSDNISFNLHLTEKIRTKILHVVIRIINKGPFKKYVRSNQMSAINENLLLLFNDCKIDSSKRGGLQLKLLKFSFYIPLLKNEN